jgi:hypothetical protein
VGVDLDLFMHNHEEENKELIASFCLKLHLSKGFSLSTGRYFLFFVLLFT